VPLFILRRDDETLLGAITLDNIRRGPAQAATLGYWIGAAHARQGYMREAIEAVVHYASARWTSAGSRPPACPRTPPRAGCWKRPASNTKGVAQSYLQINGRWRNHVLYANLRHDRRGRTDVGRTDATRANWTDMTDHRPPPDAAGLPATALREAEPRYLEEPRGRWQGRAAGVVAPGRPRRSRRSCACAATPAPGHSLWRRHRPGRRPTGRDGPAPLILSLERMRAIRSFDAEAGTMTVEAGAILADIHTRRKPRAGCSR
jgi:hypothetical protein